ncbi:hypothetical protein BJX76DRAFT_354620 [Aspergillus varians]
MSTTTLTFYDIATRPPVEKSCCAPNPWKARQALNFKSLSYKTTWVDIPNIPKVRRDLNVPPCRKFADGSDFYTLPILHDPSTNSLLGDSFDIAVYLQKTYPDSGAGNLFPDQNQKLDYTFTQDPAPLVPLTECRDSPFPDYALFNVNVDAAFTAHVQQIVQNFPFDPATIEATKAEFVRRAGLAGVARWEDFALVGEAREKTMRSFERTLGDLAVLFLRDPTGPFLLGSTPCYADLIVGGWLHMMGVTLPEREWEEVKGWHGGVFGRLVEALEVFGEVK